MPDPTYANDLVLANTFIQHDGLARQAEVTYAVNDASVNWSAQQWADALQNVFQDNLKTRIDTDAVIVKTTTLKGDGTSTFTTGESTASGTRGTAPFSAAPANCAQLVRKITAFGGRKNRGRMYLPWSINEGLVDEIGSIDATFTADTQAKLDDWRDAITDTGGHLVIANRVYDRPWNQPNRQLVSVDMGEEVIGVPVDSMMATQRRRMPRH